jgi:hypothetical protein
MTSSMKSYTLILLLVTELYAARHLPCYPRDIRENCGQAGPDTITDHDCTPCTVHPHVLQCIHA